MQTQTLKYIVYMVISSKVSARPSLAKVKQQSRDGLMSQYILIKPNSPATFMRMMNRIFGDMYEEGIIAFVDDILI
jgi:hypothetical protein